MKKIFKFSMLCILAIVLFGCGKAKVTTIEFWTPFTGGDGDTMQKIVTKFNETNKDKYLVNLQLLDAADEYQKYQAAVSAKDGLPDMLIVHAEKVIQYEKAGTLKPLDSYVGKIGIKKENYIQGVWNATEIDGKRYAIPLDVHGAILFYNKDILAKIGYTEKDLENLTWNKALEMAGKVQGAMGKDYYGFAFDSDVSWMGSRILYGAFLQNNIARMKNGKAVFNTAAAAKQMDELLKAKKYSTPLGTKGSPIFDSGNSLFIIDGTWHIGQIIENGGDKLHWGEVGLPKFGSGSGIWANSHNIVVDSNVKPEKDEAIASFLKYMSESGLEWAASGQLPANTTLYSNPEFQKLPQFALTKNNYLENFVFPDASNPKFWDILEQVGKQFNLLWTEQEKYSSKKALDISVKKGEELIQGQ